MMTYYETVPLIFLLLLMPPSILPRQAKGTPLGQEAKFPAFGHLIFLDFWMGRRTN